MRRLSKIFTGILDLSQWFSKRVIKALDFDNFDNGDIFVGATDIQLVDTRDATEHSMMSWLVSPIKNELSPKYQYCPGNSS